MYRIIGADGREYGPVTADELRQWIALHRCDAESSARSESSPDWKPLGQFNEFSAALSAAMDLPATSFAQANTKPTSGLAIGSFVCGVLGICFCLTAPVGLILGFKARRQIRESQGKLLGVGLAAAGIILSSLGLVFFLLAAGCGFFVSATQKAHSIQCQNNLRQLSQAVLMYANDHHSQLPPAVTWCDAISNKVHSAKVFVCPSEPNADCSYAVNQKLDGKLLKDVNSKTVLLFESDAGWNGVGGAESLASDRHAASRRTARFINKGETILNVTFVDGSSAEIPASGLGVLRWDP